MGLNDTPSANRIHIGFFGRRNAGKSSLVNAVTGQQLSVVSDTLGTTTDPVYKSMELLPLGPVMIIDTPGFDDAGSLGELRVQKARQVLNKTDIALLVIDAKQGMAPSDQELLGLIQKRGIPHLVVYNKADASAFTLPEGSLAVSAQTGQGIEALKEKIGSMVDTGNPTTKIIGDLIQAGDFVVLVVPIDSAAPKGRLILPQQQTIRDVLEAGATAVVARESELKDTLAELGKRPSMVITDSQAFEQVNRDTPEDIPLTSFSILMARYKGYLDTAARGIFSIDRLKDQDRILIAEGCTHHRQCEDIGTVKIPNWIRQYTGKKLQFQTCSGTEFPEDLSDYAMVIHCGGCMLNEREVQYRMHCAMDQHIPFTNYGVTIAYMNGILKRSLSLFPYLAQTLLESEQQKL